jgi:hypothetical protein
MKSNTYVWPYMFLQVRLKFRKYFHWLHAEKSYLCLPSHDFQRIHDKNNRAFTKKDQEDESIKEGYTFSQKSVVSCRRTSIVYLKKVEISRTLSKSKSSNYHHQTKCTSMWPYKTKAIALVQVMSLRVTG